MAHLIWAIFFFFLFKWKKERDRCVYSSTVLIQYGLEGRYQVCPALQHSKCLGWCLCCCLFINRCSIVSWTGRGSTKVASAAWESCVCSVLKSLKSERLETGAPSYQLGVLWALDLLQTPCLSWGHSFSWETVLRLLDHSTSLRLPRQRRMDPW